MRLKYFKPISIIIVAISASCTSKSSHISLNDLRAASDIANHFQALDNAIAEDTIIYIHDRYILLDFYCRIINVNGQYIDSSMQILYNTNNDDVYIYYLHSDRLYKSPKNNLEKMSLALDEDENSNIRDKIFNITP